MDWSILEQNYLLRCWDSRSLLNWIRALILSLLWKLWSFFLVRLLFISVNLPSGLARNTVVMFAHRCWLLPGYNRQNKGVCRTVDFSRAASLASLVHLLNVTTLSLLCRCYFVRWLSDLVQLVPPLHWCGRSTCYSYGLLDFSFTIPRCYKDVCVNDFITHLPVECFTLT